MRERLSLDSKFRFFFLTESRFEIRHSVSSHFSFPTETQFVKLDHTIGNPLLPHSHITLSITEVHTPGPGSCGLCALQIILAPWSEDVGVNFTREMVRESTTWDCGGKGEGVRVGGRRGGIMDGMGGGMGQMGS